MALAIEVKKLTCDWCGTVLVLNEEHPTEKIELNEHCTIWQDLYECPSDRCDPDRVFRIKLRFGLPHSPEVLEELWYANGAVAVEGFDDVTKVDAP